MAKDPVSAAMKLHPLCAIFPPMGHVDRLMLSQSIKERGYDTQFPIITCDGKILDGRNRYDVCQELGVTPIFEKYSGDDPRGFVLSANLARRHLDESQRGMVAAKLANMKKGGDRDSNKSRDAFEISQPEAAKLLNVGVKTVQRAKIVLENAESELIEAVEQGSVSVTEAVDLVVLTPSEQKKIAAIDDEKKRKTAVKSGRVKAKEKKKPKTSKTGVEQPKEDARPSEKAEAQEEAKAMIQAGYKARKDTALARNVRDQLLELVGKIR